MMFNVYEDKDNGSEYRYGVKSETDTLKPSMPYDEATDCCKLLNELELSKEALLVEYYKLEEKLDKARVMIEVRDVKIGELEHKLECCEYQHFLKELEKVREKVENGDYSDFGNLTMSKEECENKIVKW